MTTHKELSMNRWSKLSLIEQMANIGSELSRSVNWKGRDEIQKERSFFRVLELLFLTMKDKKNRKRLKEIARAKEILIDWYLENSRYRSTDRQLLNYFTHFAIAARKNT